jgi:hypothetical protein
MQLTLDNLTGLNRKQLQHYLGWAKRKGLTDIRANGKTADLETEWSRIVSERNDDLLLVGYWAESDAGHQLFLIEFCAVRRNKKPATKPEPEEGIKLDDAVVVDGEAGALDALSDALFVNKARVTLEGQTKEVPLESLEKASDNLDRRLLDDIDGTINAVIDELGEKIDAITTMVDQFVDELDLSKAIPSTASPDFQAADLTRLTATNRLSLTMESGNDWYLEEVFEIPGGTLETYKALISSVAYLARTKYGHDARKVPTEEWRSNLALKGWKLENHRWNYIDPAK